MLLKDVPADAQVKVTFAADAAVYQRDYAEEVYEILEKADVYKRQALCTGGFHCENDPAGIKYYYR